MGDYEVDFNQDVTMDAFLATIGPSGGGTAGDVDVAARSSNVDAVFVETRTSSGTVADLPFHLGVFG